MTTETQDINAEAKRLIDNALADLSSVNIVEASDMTNLLLDIRILLSETEQVSGR